MKEANSRIEREKNIINVTKVESGAIADLFESKEDVDIRLRHSCKWSLQRCIRLRTDS